MKYPLSRHAASAAALALGLCAAFPAQAEDADPEGHSGHDILVVGQKHNDTIENAPSTRVTIDQGRIATTVNAVNVEDTIKYLPSLVVRKRHIGDTFAPIATRTSGLGSSARSLIYADGAPLSALIANNNGNGSPRWNMVTPEEIAQVEVLYGPFSAAYPGNSIGTVVNIVTRMPDALEARVSALSNVQQFDQYGTHQTLPSWQVAGSIGDRFGPLALFASATRTNSNSQPLAYVTAASAPAGTTGAFDIRNRLGVPMKVLGAGGIEHHRQDNLKLKAALDLSAAVQVTYVLGLWRDDSQGTVESYLEGATRYTPAFSSNVYRREAEHWSHALTVHGRGDRFDWHLVGTLYRYGRDIQRTLDGTKPGGQLPAGFAGGPGNVQRQDGTGWATFDAKGAWHAPGGAHVVSFGAHFDRYRIEADRYGTADWTSDQQGAVNQISRGRTRTLAVWAQDAWHIRPDLTLTLGGRYEWWRAWDGFLFPTTGKAEQPQRRSEGFSPKASLEWKPSQQWSARLSFGQAYRFPTVGELYQAVTTGSVVSVPDPNLKPERARSEELAIEHANDHGTIRLSLFNEVIDNALIAQSGLLNGQTATFVQNVDRTRARGVELAVDRRDVVPHVDLSGSVTYADAKTVRNGVFPAAEGKLLPGVPHWKASAVVTWRPTEKVSLTAAARYASRNYATLDNSDTVGNTYQGFYKYFVVDARAQFRVTEHFELAVGVDNLNNDKYFLFHPFPQRSFTVEASWKM